MATKKRKKSVPKCYICKKPRIDPKGYSARVGKRKICVSCALDVVSKY